MKRIALLAGAAVLLLAQSSNTNYDEAKVPKYDLPGVLTLKNGERVHDAKTWTAKRRAEILEIYRTEVFGRAPGKAPHVTFQTEVQDRQALGGKAIRKVVTISFADGANT